MDSGGTQKRDCDLGDKRIFLFEIAPIICRVGWVIYCTSCEKIMYGKFFKLSAHAGSYRAELLGLLAIHILVVAVKQFYNIIMVLAKI